MALAATEASLERLQQQVNNGQVGIAAACLRIENTIQTLCRDDTTRPFLSLLPRLTTLFFGGTSLEGDQNQMGWVELASDSTGMDALFTLLHPNGVLFQACLAYSCCDGIATFDMEITQLPVPLQKAIHSLGNKALPAPFDAAIVNVSREGPPLYLLRLDAAEFFLFRFISMLLSIRKHGLSIRSNSGSGILSGKNSIFPLARHHTFESLRIKIKGDNAFRFRHDGCAQLYGRLLQSYLSFFMPLKLARDETAFSIRTLKGASGNWTGWRLANFFFTSIFELWLHQVDYRLIPGGSGHGSLLVESDPAFPMPSIDHFECIRVLTRHLVTAVTLTPMPGEAPLIPSQLLRFYDQLIDASFVSLRVLLYRFLRLSLAKCPLDNTITAIGSVWLDFIAPWRYTSAIAIPKDKIEVEGWNDYIVNNFFFYHTLLNALLDYVEVIGESFGDAISKPGANIDDDSIRTALVPLLVLVARVLSAISPYTELIKDIERHDLQPSAAMASSSNWFIRRPPTTSTSASASTRLIKEQLSALESERFTIELLFDDASINRVLRLLYWMEQIYAALPLETASRRPMESDASMDAISQLDQLDEFGGISRSHDRSHSHRHSHGHSHIHSYSHSHSLPTLSLSFSQEDSALNRSKENNFDPQSLIMQCEEELSDIFGIGEADYEGFREKFEASRKAQQPPLSPDGRLLKQRRVPISNKNKTIAIAPPPPTSSSWSLLLEMPAAHDPLIRSYEVTLLVKAMAMATDLSNAALEKAIAEAASREYALPRRMRSFRFNWRFLASIPNLAFLLVIYITLCFLGQVISLFL